MMDEGFFRVSVCAAIGRHASLITYIGTHVGRDKEDQVISVLVIRVQNAIEHAGVAAVAHVT